METLLSSEWVLWIFMDRFRCLPFFVGKDICSEIHRCEKGNHKILSMTERKEVQ